MSLPTQSHALIGKASTLPLAPGAPISSFAPVTLPIPSRAVPLQLRVTFPPLTTDPLPILLLSHGHGPSNYLSSLEGYAPVSQFFASHGFAVLQPTHLSSRSLSLPVPEDGNEMYAFDRPLDMSRILDHLDEVENSVPGLKGRLDRSNVAAMGHSFGGFTTSLLLGATNTDPRTHVANRVRSAHEPRIKAGVLIGTTGTGGDDMSETGKKMLPLLHTDFSNMRTPTLVLAGEDDASAHLTVRGPEWHRDAYTLAPGGKTLFRVNGAEHGFGGISGWDAAECKDESPELLAGVLRLMLAYLRNELLGENKQWEETVKALEKTGLGSVEHKSS